WRVRTWDPFGEVSSNAVLSSPRPCRRTIVGKGPDPVAGRVTSTSIGIPSNVGTRWAAFVVGQNRTPFWAVHAWPNGVRVTAAAAVVATATEAAATTTAHAAIHKRFTSSPEAGTSLQRDPAAGGLSSVQGYKIGAMSMDAGSNAGGRCVRARVNAIRSTNAS